ncbi:MAG: hypothetical protein JSR44_01255 [Spirochaetes bacterium]|nr:hypothetical protein [Spirochaetota bacterium]
MSPNGKYFRFQKIFFITFLILLVAQIIHAQATTVEDFLERGKEHFERRRYLNALDAFRVVLDMSAGRNARTFTLKREAEILSAESLATLGRHEEAVNMFERALAHGYENKKVAAYLALYYERAHRYEEALPYFERYFAADKSDIATHAKFAATLGRLGNRARAKAILEQLEPAKAQQSVEACLLLERQKRLKAALPCAKAQQLARPDKEQHYLSVYRIATALKDRRAAREYAEFLFYLFGDEPRYIWPLVEVTLRERKFYDARKLLEEIIRLRGTDSDAEQMLANLKIQAGGALEKPNRATNKEVKMLGL